MRQKLKMPLIAVCLCLTGAGTANAQWVVSDPGNLAQSIINSAKEMVETAGTKANTLNGFLETKKVFEQGKKYFSVASGGGTGRTLHPDNMAAGPASYGMTDTMGRMHSDAQFAGSSSVPAHVEMMGFLGMGNNPMVGATVAVAVAVAQSLK